MGMCLRQNNQHLWLDRGHQRSPCRFRRRNVASYATLRLESGGRSRSRRRMCSSVAFYAEFPLNSRNTIKLVPK